MMTWTFILGVVYGIAFLLNVKLCQRNEELFGIGGSITGIMAAGLSSLIAMGKNGAGLTGQQWMAPFLTIVFFFIPNFITGAGFLLNNGE